MLSGQTKHALLLTFFSIIVKGKNHYCVPHPQTLLALLKRFHKTEIQLRWLFQCLRDLEDDGYINRRRRWKHTDGPAIRSDSSIWTFTIKGMELLASRLVHGASELLKRMRAWLLKNDKRFPRESDINPKGQVPNPEVYYGHPKFGKLDPERAMFRRMFENGEFDNIS